MYYKIGLDVGIASVGWATVLLDKNDEPCRILDLGVRIFKEAEQPKTGASLAEPRRAARGMRRRLRRHRHRLDRIKGALVRYGVLSLSSLENLYPLCPADKDVYTLRAEALGRCLAPTEWARVLIHLAQRRGFKSNRKSELAEKDVGKLLQAIKSNTELMQTKGYHTVGEMLYKDSKFKDYKRNKAENYSFTMPRDLLVEEITRLFEAQRQHGSALASSEFENVYKTIFTSQRSFDEGPGGNSPYGGDQIVKMIGKCTFEKGEDRAPKASPTFEYFTLLQKLNHLRIQSPRDKRPLNKAERQKIIEMAYKTKELTWTKIRKELGLAQDETFSELSYGRKPREEVEKATLGALKYYHTLRKALNEINKDHILTYSHDTLDQIADILTRYKSDKNITKNIAPLNLPAADADAVQKLSFSKFGHLSLKACRKILPFLEQGLNYNEACQQAGYNFKGHENGEKFFTLPLDPQNSINDVFENITSPVVRRGVSQALKVINAIIRYYGESPAYVGIELARELSKNHKERDAAEKSMEENRAKNQRALERIQEYGKISPTGLDIVKLKLWEEQGGICPYSLKPLEISRLFETGYADIDHIIPYSISFDDSYKNKVLVHAEENRQKGNRLPMEYLQGEPQDNFVVWVKNSRIDHVKKSKLLKEKLTQEEIEDFKKRNLQDTQYLAALLYNYINDHLLFAQTPTNRKKKVTAVNGAITGYLRSRWGILKIRENGDLHHSVDAAVVACTTDGVIQKVTRYQQGREKDEDFTDPVTGEVFEKFPQPYPLFRKELEIRLENDPVTTLIDLRLPQYEEVNIMAIKPVFVSQMPRRKVSGAAHKETIKSLREITIKEEPVQVAVKKVSLSDLKLNKEGEIEGYYNPESDRLLYQALKTKLAAYNGDGKEAFKDKAPFYKPTASGKPGPLVQKVKVYEKCSLPVPVHGGKAIADNDTMVRIDVFYVPKEGYYFVPLYMADTLKRILPSLGCIAFKPYEQWRPLEDKDFIFSLYPGDLVKIIAKKPMEFSLCNEKSTLDKKKTDNACLCYYVSADIATASIAVTNHDRTYKLRGLGVKTLVSLEKYQVDILGNVSSVSKEERMPFIFKKRGIKNGLSTSDD